MRAFSTLLIAAALALSGKLLSKIKAIYYIDRLIYILIAHAALVKRTDDPQIQLCMDDLTDANAQLAIVKDAVDTFDRSKGYSGALNIHDEEQVLEARLKTAGTSCCAVSAVASTADADAFLDVVDTMVPLVQGALTSIVTKKPEFDAIFLATTIVKTDIKNLNNQANQLLDNCLFDVTPPSHTAIATTHVAAIKSAFATAKTAYGIP
ncbi:hypothetical protein BDF21DRAFT_343698 [Thamnidium elegans]|uniref:Uncharacterized protein n=1 Tax=Thamnidium elegans TaxID=101142 RepID=A0A8H7SLK5_9FUNG|nr:hypothetical protein INT48_006235 [Thamnidium elegans]KAI8073654.1 hypothetical protein BDF21DRAFT_343698 [Thamnidium elegans]